MVADQDIRRTQKEWWQVTSHPHPSVKLERLPKWILVASVLICQSCYDKLQPPVFYNGSDSPVLVHCETSDGRSHRVELQPRTAFWQRENGLYCVSLQTMMLDGTVIGEYTESKLNEMRKAQPSHEEVWLIEEGRLSLLDRLPGR